MGMLVFPLVQDQGLTRTAQELLGGGRCLAEILGLKVSAALIGDGLSHLAGEVVAYGADRVYMAEHELLREYNADLFLETMVIICQMARPDVVLLVHDDRGRELAPRLAYRLGTGAITDCINLQVNPETKTIIMFKPVYGGKAIGIMRVSCKPWIATVRPGTFQAITRDGHRNGEVVPVPVTLDSSLVRVNVRERIVREKVQGPKLEEAKIVVAGGRGIGGIEGFKQLEELASILKAAVGASRAACDAGWVPPSWQIGQTGKKIAADLYIAVGISGASQHVAGLSAVKHIIAINKDPNAPIFKFAQIGIIEDYRKVIPLLIKKLRGISNF